MAIDTHAVVERIHELEAELVRLRAQLHSSENTKSFRDLRGSMKGMLSLTDEELEEAEFKLEWDKIDPQDDAA
jgi:hypothetical protein